MIRVAGASYSYRRGHEEVSALDDISFEVSRGEFVVFAGHNGSGKSTLAKLLNGLLLPSRGSVTVDGIDTSDASNLWHVRRNVGMVFQNPENQIVATVVEDDVAFGPENLGLPPAEIRDRIDEALKKVNLSGHSFREPHNLSGGEKQRVAIAGVLAMRPNYLVLDECTSHLDSGGRAQVQAVLRELADRSGMAIIYFTHFLKDVLDADRVVLLRGGRIVEDGPPRGVVTSAELLEKAGVPVPPGVALAANLRSAGVNVRPGVLTIEELAEAICELS
ncbi:MAG: energy-coupling factor transporter ATPase [Terriglobia bacterium]